MHPNLLLGQAGESLAAAWYTDAGFTILERNWCCAQGEIDLLCTRDQTLVVCEVKTRQSDRHGAPAEAVTRTKQLRLRRLAIAYLRTYGGHYDEVRFDVASVLGSQLTIIEGAF